MDRSPVIERYEREYLRCIKDYQEISNKADLIKRVLVSDLVYHGDYHTLRQSQRSVLRILREIQGKRDIILCMETFHETDQKFVNSFLSGDLAESSFLKKIKYSKKWPFSWANWSPIVLFCKDNHIPILGINSQGEEGIRSLRDCDRSSARIIVKSLIRYPDKLIYVVDGDYHISPNHLPKSVEGLLKQLDVQVRSLIIYQNAENLYWRLCREKKEEADVLKISDNSYCVMNTMPANKVQSYLNWLEYAEDAYYPIHRDWQDEAFESQGITIEAMVSVITSVLDLKLPADAFQRLTIYYSSDLHFMDLIYNTPELKSHIRLIREKIRRDEGFLLQYERSGKTRYIIYLTNSSINMAAEEAAHFVNAAVRGPMKVHLDPFNRFYRNLMIECLGFFGSKFINEKRKSQSEYSLRKFLGQINRGEHEQMDPVIAQSARCMLQHFYLQKKTNDPAEFKKKFHHQYKSRSSLPQIFSTQMGYMMGNKLYYAVKRGEFSIGKIRQYFQEPFDAPGHAFECSLAVSKQLRKVKPGSQF